MEYLDPNISKKIVDGFFNYSSPEDRLLNTHLETFIIKISKLTHLHSGDYIGLYGTFTNNVFRRLWLYYRIQNNIKLNEIPINVNFDIELKEYENELYEHLKPYFKQLETPGIIISIIITELSNDKVNDYMYWIQQLPHNIETKVNELSLNKPIKSNVHPNDILANLEKYNSTHIIMGNNTSWFPIVEYKFNKNNEDYKIDNNNNNEKFEMDNKISLIKVIKLN